MLKLPGSSRAQLPPFLHGRTQRSSVLNIVSTTPRYMHQTSPTGIVEALQVAKICSSWRQHGGNFEIFPSLSSAVFLEDDTMTLAMTTLDSSA